MAWMVPVFVHLRTARALLQSSTREILRAGSAGTLDIFSNLRNLSSYSRQKENESRGCDPPAKFSKKLKTSTRQVVTSFCVVLLPWGIRYTLALCRLSLL